MTDNNHPFADKGTKPADPGSINIPFADSATMILFESRASQHGKTANIKKKVTPKQREQQAFEVINKSLANVKLSEQLFASNKKQVIFGNVPSKSNCYKIITINSKDPKKHGFSSLASTDKLKRYEKDFFIQCNVYRNKMLEGYLQIEVDVYYPNQRSDLDNSLKVILDCLQKVKAFNNDNMITRIVANKFLDKLNPRVEFEIKQSM